MNTNLPVALTKLKGALALPIRLEICKATEVELQILEGKLMLKAFQS